MAAPRAARMTSPMRETRASSSRGAPRPAPRAARGSHEQRPATPRRRPSAPPPVGGELHAFELEQILDPLDRVLEGPQASLSCTVRVERRRRGARIGAREAIRMQFPRQVLVAALERRQYRARGAARTLSTAKWSEPAAGSSGCGARTRRRADHRPPPFSHDQQIIEAPAAAARTARSRRIRTCLDVFGFTHLNPRAISVGA